MKAISVFTSLLALGAATPTPTRDELPVNAHLAKRATVTDKCNLGYGTLNGGYVTENLVLSSKHYG
jgi:hypothetical protein